MLISLFSRFSTRDLFSVNYNVFFLALFRRELIKLKQDLLMTFSVACYINQQNSYPVYMYVCNIAPQEHYEPRHGISVSYCMVCAYVREDTPRALASGLSHVHTHNHTITALLRHVCMCTLCIVR